MLVPEEATSTENYPFFITLISLDLGGGRPRDVAVAPEKRLELRPARHSLTVQSYSAQNATTGAHAERFSVPRLR